MKQLHLWLALSLASAVGFLVTGELPFLFIAVAGAVLLITALWRQLELLAALGFILLVAAAGLHVWKGGAAPLALSSVCASLAAWDLTSYGLLLRRTGTPPGGHLFQRRLRRLLGVLAGGWALGGLALLFELSLGFGLLLALALFVVLSLSASMMYLRRRDAA